MKYIVDEKDFDINLGSDGRKYVVIEKDKLQHIQEETEKPNKRWRAERGIGYYYISDIGSVISSYEREGNIDDGRYAIGNYFSTRAETEYEVESLKVIAELKEYAEPDYIVWHGIEAHWYIIYDVANSKLSCDYHTTFRGDNIYFASRKDMETAIDAVGEERILKYYLKITRV